MKAVSDNHRPGRARMPFGIVLGLTMAVALLSALVPIGPPSSRHGGSAFSPATTSVAIRARAVQPVLLQSRVTPPPGDPPVIALFQPLMPLPIAVTDTGTAAVWFRPTAIFHALTLSWHQPRAPPSAVPPVAL